MPHVKGSDVLGPTSTLRIRGSDRLVRLSYIFQDDDGSRIGVTSGWLHIEARRASEDCRPDVLHDDGLAGILNPPFDPAGDHARSKLLVLGAGFLTGSFALARDARVSDQFSLGCNRSISPMESLAGDEVRILGEGLVGTVLDELENLRTGSGIVYPLLRLQRSPSDLSRSDPGIRNGAMVTTRDEALIGVIVGLSKDRCTYSVAPIADVLNWHRLSFLEPSNAGIQPSPLTQPHTVTLPLLPGNVDQRYRALVDA